MSEQKEVQYNLSLNNANLLLCSKYLTLSDFLLGQNDQK